MKRSCRCLFVFLVLISFIFSLRLECLAQNTVIRAEDFAGEFLNERHSMRDPSGYAAVKTLEGVAAKAACGEYERIYIIEGGEAAVKSFLEKSRALEIKKVESQNSRGEKWDYFECVIEGKKAACEYHVFGEDMLRHIMLCYSFRNIDASKIRGILRDDSFAKIYLDFYKSLKIAGNADYGIIGYRRAVVRHIYWRINAHRKALALKEFIEASGGAHNASDVLKAAVIKAAGLKFYIKSFRSINSLSAILTAIENERDLKKFFVNSADFYRIDEADKSAADFYKKSPLALKASAPFSMLMDENGLKFKMLEGRAGEYFTDIPFDVRRVMFLDRNGDKRSFIVCEHPYGKSAMAMASAMARLGMKKIIFYGTCGSFVKMPKYSVIIPGGIAGSLGRVYGNPLYERNKNSVEKSGAVLTKKHASVYSPLTETIKAVNEFIMSGIGSVDCEAAHVFEAPACNGAERSAVFIASDFPGTDSTIESWERENDCYIRAQMKILDILIKEFDIAEIILR